MPQEKDNKRTLLEQKLVRGFQMFADCNQTLRDHEEERQREMMPTPADGAANGGKNASNAALEAAFKRTQRYDAKGRSVSTPATKKS